MPTPPYHPAITGPDPGPPLLAVLLAALLAVGLVALLARLAADWARTLRSPGPDGHDEPAAECDDPDDGRTLPCPGCGGRGCCPDCDGTGSSDDGIDYCPSCYGRGACDWGCVEGYVTTRPPAGHSWRIQPLNDPITVLRDGDE